MIIFFIASIKLPHVVVLLSVHLSQLSIMIVGAELGANLICYDDILVFAVTFFDKRPYLLVELLLLFGEDTGNLLRELHEVPQLRQLLTDPTDVRRKGTAAGHGVGKLTLWWGPGCGRGEEYSISISIFVKRGETIKRVERNHNNNRKQG